ncbi:helix-turn-helix domain-containing protein [Paenibacillus arenilitoris]|uniref:Helix-turn-helix domain-containing protein n=1 Tax=Paenibacillus arenilitoris TaxID=2772299 RepID=A0A927CHD2_9BACL|nr:helix-turn-helix domain-containing protein [Paenibacillus arenilitoris]MBD2867057.1 helix-turn-helix domain-containing protein [Paenibacillus arenilitoris]
MYKMLIVDLNRHTDSKTMAALDWSELGFTIENNAGAADGALAQLASKPYSLVLINMVGMPDEGLALCSRIRAESRIPILLIGDGTNFQLARKAMYYQVSDYLPAPLCADELSASLRLIKRKLDSAGRADREMRPSESAPSDLSVIDKVKEYVTEALSQTITLKQISNILHFNCSYLGQKFKYHENMTFNEYLLQQRMEKAKFLLESTDLKVYEIASEVGYSEMDWFYKKFKSYTGVSANEYRKMMSITA